MTRVNGMGTTSTVQILRLAGLCILNHIIVRRTSRKYFSFARTGMV